MLLEKKKKRIIFGNFYFTVVFLFRNLSADINFNVTVTLLSVMVIVECIISLTVALSKCGL